MKEMFSKFPEVLLLDGTYSVNNCGMLLYSILSEMKNCLQCTCLYFASALLPCKHIFAVRAFEGLSVFDVSLVPQQWLLSYQLSQRQCDDPQPLTLPPPGGSKKCLTTRDKFNAVQKLALAIADALSCNGMTSVQASGVSATEFI